MRNLRLLPPALLALLAVAPSASAAPVQEVALDFLGRTPAGTESNQAEIAAFDAATQRVFVTNADENALDVFDFSDPSAPAPVESIDLTPFGAGPSSVAVNADGLVAVAQQGTTAQTIGSVQFFDVDGNRLGAVRAGALPDTLTYTKDGRYLLVANEGEPDNLGVDPPGSVTVIDTEGGIDDLVVQHESFDGVPLRGPVRLFTPGATVSQELEPEYITTKGDTAYVSVQEANAIGILDIETAEFRVVRSLGFKDHGVDGQGLDPSDDDGGVNIAPWDNLLGIYQPDAIAAYTVAGKGKKDKKETFIATANEGDTRAFDFFDEESRVGALTLDPDAFAADAGDDENLGRLVVTTTLGDDDGDGDYDRLFSFGGRSMSIVDTDGRLAYDTGDELEQIADDLDPTSFNTDNAADSDPDNRSDNKGPEPEALTVGKVGDRQYSFVGAERSGGLYAYDLGAKPGEARFAGYANTRVDDLGPEGALFIAAGKSPTGAPLVLFTYEISSTVAAYEVTPIVR